MLLCFACVCVCQRATEWVSDHTFGLCVDCIWAVKTAPVLIKNLGSILLSAERVCVRACVRACMRVCVYVCVCLKGNLDHRVHSRWGGTVFEENLLWTYLFSAVCSGCLCVFLSACYGPPECVFVCALSMRDTVAEVITWTVCSTDFLSVYFAAISQHGSMCLRLCCTGVTFHRV